MISAAHTDKKLDFFHEYRNYSKENMICDIFNHSQENFVMVIKKLFWFCSDTIFLKKTSKTNPVQGRM